MKKSLLLLALLPAFFAPAMAALFIADYAAVPETVAAPAPLSSAPVTDLRTAGLYVHILDGMIVVVNPGGSQTMSTGQFAYVGAAATPPVMLPRNPGLMYTPPPTFQAPGSGSRPPVGSNVGGVDCEVR